MSKCKPKLNAEAVNKGIQLADEVQGSQEERYVVLKIPYNTLLTDAEVSQMRVQDLVKIAIVENSENKAEAANSQI